MNQAELQQWLKERGEKDDRLYEQYGRPLEAEHTGEWVAIGDNGETILGPNELQVSKQALLQFGPRAFAFRRIGTRADIRVLRCGR
jgi:hypothetical protein